MVVDSVLDLDDHVSLPPGSCSMVWNLFMDNDPDPDLGLDTPLLVPIVHRILSQPLYDSLCTVLGT